MTEHTEGRDPHGRFTRHPATVDRDAAALGMRAAGATFAEIAAELGYADKSAARKAVQRGLSEPLAEPAAEVRALEAERLERLTAAAYKVLEREHVLVSHGRVVMHDGRPIRDDGPRLAAIDRLLKIQERRARLLGLDTPFRVSVDADALGREIEELLGFASSADGGMLALGPADADQDDEDA